MQKEVIIPIYEALTCILVNPSIDAALKYLNEAYDLDEIPIQCKGMVNSKFSNLYQKRIFYMYIDPRSTKNNYMNTAAHELFHLTQEILEDRGVYFKRRDANEPYAYVQGCIFGEYIEFLEKAYKRYNTIRKTK